MPLAGVFTAKTAINNIALFANISTSEQVS